MRLFPIRLTVCYSPADEAGGAGGGGVAAEVADPIAAELAQLRKERAERVAADQARAEQEAAEKGEHVKLAATLKAERDALKAENERLAKGEAERLKRVEAKNAERVKAIPEGRRSLVPASLRGEELADYLETNWALLGGEEMAAGTLAKPRAGGDDKPPPECVAEAERHGVPVATWYANIWKPRETAAAKARGSAS